MMERCGMCPRACGARRLAGKTGMCKSGVLPVVASANVHHGEEPPITGARGSGTVFFSGCNMQCVFCQNFPISQLGVGKRMTVTELARKMLGLQKRGAENINFVTPTHFMAQAAHAVFIARRKGLAIPIVWNTSGYESVEPLRLLEGFVDIYLCDYRYATPELAKKFSGAPDYPAVVEPAIEEMLRQVGHFDGQRGVIIRHLCMPGHLDETQKVLERIRQKFGERTTVSFMSQFFPAHRCAEFPEINRRMTEEEMEEARKLLERSGLENGWVQLEYSTPEQGTTPLSPPYEGGEGKGEVVRRLGMERDLAPS